MVRQYEIYSINLNPTIGHEINKRRPCLIISPDSMNKYIGTVIIAPMTSTNKKYPTRIKTVLNNKQGYIVLDQIRTIDKNRIEKKLGILNKITIKKVKNLLKEMLID